MSDGEREAVLLRVYVREGEQRQGKPLYAAIVEAARSAGLAGATVLRGIDGFGLRKTGASDADQPAGEPLVIEIIDWEDKAEPFLGTLREMVAEGLVTKQSVSVAAYRSRTG